MLKRLKRWVFTMNNDCNDKTTEKKIENLTEEESIHTQEAEQESQTTIAPQDPYKEKFLALSADLQNYKRRVTAERIAWTQMAQEDVLKPLLPIFADLDRAIELAEKQHNEELNKWLDGFKLLQKQWQKIFDELGIQEIPGTGMFDPALHEALMQVDAPDKASGEIVQLLDKGYLFKGKVIRHAKVSVAR